MFSKIGSVVVRHPWYTIAAWVVAAVLLIAFAPKFEASSEQTDFLPDSYESVKAFDLAEKAFPNDKGQTSVIVATRTDGGKLSDTDEQRVKDLASALQNKKFEGVSKIEAGSVSENRQVQMVDIQFSSKEYGNHETTEAIKDIRSEIKQTMKDSGLKAEVTGEAAIGVDSEESFKKSDQITLMATVVVIFVLLLLTFRSILAALLPLLTVFLVMAVAFSIIGSVNEIFNLTADQITQSLMPIVLFGVGTDYILFLLFRYRERLRAGEDKKKAMVSAVSRVGEVIASAAAAVIVAFSALVLASLGMLQSLGPAMSIAVATMLVASLTLIPAVVSLIGPKIFWPSKAWKSEPKHGLSGKLGGFVGRRPLAVVLVSAVILVGLSVSALGFKPDFNAGGAAPENTEAAKGLESMKKGFPPGALDATQIFLRSTNGQALSDDAVNAEVAALDKTKGVGDVKEPQRSDDGTVAQIDVELSDDPLSEAARDQVRGEIRDVAHKAAPEGTEAVVGGTTAVMVDLEKAMNRDYSVVFPVAGLLIAIILALLLRSLVAPIYLLISVGLSFTATIGASVLYFQHFQDHAGVVFFLPLVVYLFVVALGTDYNILTIARLREEAQAGNPPKVAVAHAFQRSALTVASAGLILAGSFATFLLADAAALQEMGVTVAVGVGLSAFVMSMFLVPAITAMLGHKAWWPGHGDAVKKQAIAEAKAEEELVGAGEKE